MRVLKFGGTSVGTPERMKEVADIITRDDVPKIVVLSALSGTTNTLQSYVDLLCEREVEKTKYLLDELQEHYRKFLNRLYRDAGILHRATEYVQDRFDYLHSFGEGFSRSDEKEILAQGELMSTHLFSWLLEDRRIDSVLVPALDFMRIDRMLEPDDFYIQSMLEKEITMAGKQNIYITQGYICRNAEGKIDNLKRGGSDYTATLIGRAIKADEIQIWTDIDGMHNNDPRMVRNTFPIKHLAYGEAAELAYFGAKILHPSCVLPAQKSNIPIKLKNTMDPDAEGTTISQQEANTDITAIAAKDGITAIKIKSGRMLMAYGFLKKVFDVFERYQTPIDMITTSEVAVSLTIDDETRLSEMLEDLRAYGEVEVDQNQTIICIVGNFASERSGYATRIFSCLAEIPVRMISYGGSRYNVSVLVQNQYKKSALEVLNRGLFGL